MRCRVGISRWSVWVLLSGILSAGACGDRSDDDPAEAVEPPAVTVRDSAGVEIVEVLRDEWSEGAGWTVDPDPILDMGTLDGLPEETFFRVRSLDRLSDGRIVVSNAGTSEVRAYRTDGTLDWSMGREGEGPGEFNSLFTARVLNDTIYAHDFMPARITVLTSEGEVVRTVSLDRSEARPLEIWPVEDGYVGLLMLFLPMSTEQTLQRRPAKFVRFDAAGARVSMITEMGGQEVIAIQRALPGGGVATAASTPMIANRQQGTVVGGRLVAAETDRWEMRVFDQSGAFERIIRAPARERPVTDEEFRAALDERLADAENDEARRNIREQAELVPPPELRPNFGRFVPDAEGYVWLAPYRPDPDRPREYTVVDPVGGRVLGTVALPVGFGLSRVGPDWVLGTERDEYDVLRIKLFGLRR